LVIGRVVIVDASATGPDTMSQMLDAAGRRRSPATMPGFHTGRAPRNKGTRYPADPPTIEEILSVMRTAGWVLATPMPLTGVEARQGNPRPGGPMPEGFALALCQLSPMVRMG
jgi:hypothetical protein